MKYWLIKSEPGVYSIDQLEKDGFTIWDGIRNYQARNNLNAMKVNDGCLFYHSNDGKAIVGLAKVKKEAFPDPGTEDPAWMAIEVAFEKRFSKPVFLENIKKEPQLQEMVLVKNSRLSVQPVLPEEFELILNMAQSNQ